MRVPRAGILLACFLLAVRAEEIRTLPRLTVGSADEWIYIGTESGETGKGLRVAARNSKTGSVSESFPAFTSTRVGGLTISPDFGMLIAANWVREFNGESSGALTAFSVDRRTSHLRLLNQVSSGGQRPGRPRFLKNGRGVLVANHLGGTIGLFPVTDDNGLENSIDLLQLDGSGSEKNPSRPMDAVFSSDGGWVLVPDLASDVVRQYPVDQARGILHGNQGGKLVLPPGSGPVGCVVDSGADTAYVLLQGRPIVAVCRFTPRNGLGEVVQWVDFPEDPDQENKGVGREIFLSPDDRTLNVLCALNPSLIQWQVEHRDGTLKEPRRLGLKGTDPRSAWFDPRGRWMLIPHKADGFVETLAFDPKTQEPSRISTLLEIPDPLSVVVVPRIRSVDAP
jgi:6-phosphogluconolactonase